MPISTAVQQSAVARVVGVKTEFRDLRGGNAVFIPQRLAVFAQASHNASPPESKKRYFDSDSVGLDYGFGSPAHLASLKLFPEFGEGVGTVPVTYYHVKSSGASARPNQSHDITFDPSTLDRVTYYRVEALGIRTPTIAVKPTDSATDIATAIREAIMSTPSMPITAGTVGAKVFAYLKWVGSTLSPVKVRMIRANDGTVDTNIVPEMELEGGQGDLIGGLEDALQLVGETWETMCVNACNFGEDLLDIYQRWGESRWGALTRKPTVVISALNDPGLDQVVGDSFRPLDKVNSIVSTPGCPESEAAVAAAIAAEVVKSANDKPANDYGSIEIKNLIPGGDLEQWSYPQRDSLVKNGVSTTIVRDGVVTLQDVITPYRPKGQVVPAYRYVCDIIKLQNVIFNVDLIFNTPEWDGKPLIPDHQPTANREAKKPLMAVAAIGSLIDSLAMEAILSNPERAKKSTRAQINEQNPKRLDVYTCVQLSGNVNIISVDLDFGFYFGRQTRIS